MRHNDPEPSFPARTSARIPAATTAIARERRRAFKRLKLHRQFVPLLVLITLLSTAGIAGLAYISSRSAAVSSAQTRAAQDAQVLRDELTAHGAPLRLSDGRFVVGTGPTALTLNNDTTLADHTQAMLNADSTIYELEGSRLIAISTTVPAAGFHSDTLPNSRDLGDALSASVTATLVGSCGTSAPSTCYQSFDGTAALGGQQYVTDVLPLFDATGAFVGAVGAALPLDTVLASTTQLSIILLLVGALLALVSLASGTWIYGARVESVLDRLDSRLNRLSDAAGDLEHLAYVQVDCSSRQSSMARQIAEQVRALDAMAQVMEQGHAALRDTTTTVWGEVSHPGIAPDLATAARLVQQTAVASARVGSAAEDARDLCRQLVTQMNHIVAEAGMVTESGRALEQRANDLRTCVEGVEITLGERIRKRMVGSSLPLVRRVRAASQHLRWILPAWAAPVTDLRSGAPDIHAAETSVARVVAPSPASNDMTDSLWSWRENHPRRDDVSRQSPVDPGSGLWLNSTGRHAAAPRPSGTLRASNLRGASSGNLPRVSPVSPEVRRGGPSGLPRSSRSPHESTSPDDVWPPSR